MRLFDEALAGLMTKIENRHNQGDGTMGQDSVRGKGNSRPSPRPPCFLVAHPRVWRALPIPSIP